MSTFTVSSLPSESGPYRLNLTSGEMIPSRTLRGEKEKTGTVSIHFFKQGRGRFDILTRIWKGWGAKKITLIEKSSGQTEEVYIKLRSIRKRTLLPHREIERAMRDDASSPPPRRASPPHRLETLLTSTVQAHQFLKERKVYEKSFAKERIDRSTLQVLFKEAIFRSHQRPSTNVLIDDTHHLGLSYDYETFTMKSYELRKQNYRSIDKLKDISSETMTPLNPINKLLMHESHRQVTRRLEFVSSHEKNIRWHYPILNTFDPSPIIEIPIVFKREKGIQHGTLFYFDRTGHHTLREARDLSPAQHEDLAKKYITQLAQIHAKGITCGHIDHQSLGIAPPREGSSRAIPYLSNFSKAKNPATEELKKQDVFELGKALYYSVTGKEPLLPDFHSTLRDTLASAPITQNLREIILKMLIPDPAQCPTAQQLVEQITREKPIKREKYE